jgi:hypothetical protein
MTDVDSLHLRRLSDRRREKWDGARDAILLANENAKKFVN